MIKKRFLKAAVIKLEGSAVQYDPYVPVPDAVELTPEPPQLFLAGEIVMFTSGEYSDYSVTAVCRVVKDFSTAQLDPARGWSGVVADAMKAGFVEELSVREIHLDTLGAGADVFDDFRRPFLLEEQPCTAKNADGGSSF